MKIERPVVVEYDGIFVVRDDLQPGGTKARYIGALYRDLGADELVYGSPAEGGAQTALATVAAALGKRATIFVAKRAEPHPRSLMAKRLGATVVQVSPGYLSVVRSRAGAYVDCQPAERHVREVPFGFDFPLAIEAIAMAARATQLKPDSVWFAAGSGVLARGLAAAWPDAEHHAVEVGHKLDAESVAGATIHESGMPFGKAERRAPPFPSDPHYDAKAWRVCWESALRRGTTVFWNVTGPAEP